MMANNNPDIAVTDGDKPLPSLEELRQSEGLTAVRANPETRRIRWALDGPLETAITVAPDYWFDVDEVREPYCLGGENPAWHPFAQSPLTEPKVSSLQLVVVPLLDWDYYWMEIHEGHTDPDAKHTYNPASVLYGPLPPGGDLGAQLQGDSDDDGEHLLMCCGEKRPLRYLGKGTRDVVIRPTTSGGDFVTIHDFISTVHPYLMARRDEILQAIGKDMPGGRLLAPETGLMVSIGTGFDVDVEEETGWTRSRKRRPKRQGKKLTPDEMNERVRRMLMDGPEVGDSSDRMRIRL